MSTTLNRIKAIKENPYPLNLYYALNERCDNKLPQEPSEDNLQGLEIALTYLSPRTRDIVIYRYRDALSSTDIGLKFDLCSARISDLLKTALRKLSSRRSLEIITRGLHGYIDYQIQSNVDEKEAVIEQRAYKKGYEEGYADALKDKEAQIREYHPASKISIEAMDLPIRPYNCLIKFGCKTVYDVLNLSSFEILKIKSLGRYGRREIALALERMGYVNDAWKTQK